jgi:hypothetical protein
MPGKLLAQPNTTDKAHSTEIQQLIHKLSHPSEATRKAAANQLESMPAAIPELRKAVDSNDFALHSRAKPILREALLRKNRRMVEGYPIDLFLERLLRLDDEYEEESYWRVAAEFNGRILDRAIREFKLPWQGKLPSHWPVYDFTRYVEQFRNDVEVQPSLIIGPGQAIPETRRIFVLRRDKIELPENRGIGNSLLASPGPIKTGRIHDSVILGGDTVKVRTAPGILTADGDVVGDWIGGIVITRGSVKSKIDIDGGLVLAGGKVTGVRRPGAIIRDNQPKLLGWVRFFEIADAGLDVELADGGVRVTKVIDQQPPQKTGLRAGDLITAMDGKPFKDIEEFRRLLRRSTVQNASKFTVRRDGTSLELTASFVGWEPPPEKK